MASIPPSVLGSPISRPFASSPGAPHSLRADQPAMPSDRVELRGGEFLRTSLAGAARSVYGFLLGDDLDNAFGASKTSVQRGLGMVSLAANFVPAGKAVGLGVKALEHAGVSILERAGVDAGGRVAERVAAESADLADIRAAAAGKAGGADHPSPNLQAIEKGRPGLPHTLAKHVNDRFEDRFAAEPRLEASSTYTDVAAAQRATDFVVGRLENQAKIGQWLKGGAKRNLPLEGTVPGSPIGKTIERADYAAGKAAEKTNDARVVLKADPASPNGYTVLTSYPTKPR
jgi:hypothetical protein